MAVYKIYYSGFAYVEADNEDEAKEIYWDNGSISEEEIINEVRFIDESEIIKFIDDYEEW